MNKELGRKLVEEGHDFGRYTCPSCHTAKSFRQYEDSDPCNCWCVACGYYGSGYEVPFTEWPSITIGKA